jgi:hypothetical protein
MTRSTVVKLVLALALACALACPAAHAGKSLAGVSWNKKYSNWSGKTYTPGYYDVMIEETIAGTVTIVDISRIYPEHIPGAIEISTAEGNAITAFLAPEWYLKKIKLKITSGQRIEVFGSVLKSDKAVTIYATEVRMGLDRFKLRERNGQPLWKQLKKMPRGRRR